ncbi:MAG TPA: hypothetical protein VII41_10110, partial [Steroidobacteraceae bacterium]
KCESPASARASANPRNKYIFFDVYFIGLRIAPPSQKSGTKTRSKKHPTDRDKMPAAGDAFPAAFPWPFKVVARGGKRAYRGFQIIAFQANPFFESRI